MTTESRRSYQAAAARSGVVVRELTELTELHEASVVLGAIWGVPDKPPMNAELLRALAKAESYVAAAYDGATMVGVCVGFHSAPAARAMHSHIAGVTSGVAGRHVGFALKLHQRAWCLDRGITLMEWTYDPLVARNAYFNLSKLGATVAEYLPDFYGVMGDGINRFDESDRILVTGRWRTRSWSTHAQGRRCALSYRPVQPRPGWPCPPTSRRCGLSTSTRPGAGA